MKWQRGTNENTSGLIRQYFSKGTDFSKISEEEIKFAQDELGNQPLKVLGWETPKKAFKKLVVERLHFLEELRRSQKGHY